MKQKDLQDSAKRAALGKLSGLVGIVCNVGLAGSKLAVGKLAGSMSITADGLNNLSDAASSIVTLTGFKLAEKPADKEHPYGHARFEYLASLTVSVVYRIRAGKKFGGEGASSGGSRIFSSVHDCPDCIDSGKSRDDDL